MPVTKTGAKFKMDQPFFSDEALLMQLKAPTEYDAKGKRATVVKDEKSEDSPNNTSSAPKPKI